MTGFLLILLGIWGAIIPFVGPYFDYAFTPNDTWSWTAARGWLQVLPGAVTFVVGLILVTTAARSLALMASTVAAAAGAWFVLGPLLTPLWNVDYLGTPVGDATDASMERLGMFFGLGAVIMLLSGIAFGRFSVVGVKDVAKAAAGETAVAAGTGPAAAGMGPVENESAEPEYEQMPAGRDADVVQTPERTGRRHWFGHRRRENVRR